MADYYTPQQLAQKLGIAEATITELQSNGLIQPTVKDGRSFLSSQQAYRLGAALRRARKDKIDLQEAFARVEERWLAQSSALKQ
jgi:predicted site-specific integrase-resolvase